MPSYYDKVIEMTEQGMVSPSLALFLFGNSRIAQKRKLQHSYNYPAVGYDICLFYSVLLQAYAISLSVKKGVLLREMPFGSNAVKEIKSTWAMKGKRAFQTLQVFSFLNRCMDLDDRVFIPNVSEKVISNFRNIYEKYNSDSAQMGNSFHKEALFELIRALPLLGSTEIDMGSKEFVFRPDPKKPKNEFRINIFPFIMFWDAETQKVSRKQTPLCYTMTAMNKGERNGEVYLSYTLINRDANDVSNKEITWQIDWEEEMVMTCKMLELKIDWYPVDDCWCDFTFLQRLAECSGQVLKDHYFSDAETRGSNMTKTINRFFHDRAIRDTVKKITGNCPYSSQMLYKLIYALYIENGVFKFMYELLLDDDDFDEGEPLFHYMMDELQRRGYITEKEKTDWMEKCTRRIAQHKESLKIIVDERKKTYGLRGREINAEWRAYTILKAAGLPSENMFMDKEALYSIDDYYDMIKNPRTALTDNLCGLLNLMNSVYDALMQKNPLTHPEPFYQYMNTIRKQNASLTWEQLFDLFIDTVRRSEKNSNIDKLIGRDRICDPDILASFKTDIQKKMEEQLHVGSKLEDDTGKRFFISYSHKDYAIVKRKVEEWRKLGIRLYFDESEFQIGENWEQKAQAAIQNQDTLGVIVFMSRNAISEAVLTELNFANAYRCDNNLEDTFIRAINLETDLISEKDGYLYRMSYQETDERATIARDLIKFLPRQKLFWNREELDSGKVGEDLLKEFRESAAKEQKIRDNDYTGAELSVANFLCFLKYGNDTEAYWRGQNEIDSYFRNGTKLSHCIFPLVASTKETKIKRDDVTILAYEMIQGKGQESLSTNYILTSRQLPPDDYYCIPNYRLAADDCSWMVEPVMLNFNRFDKETIRTVNMGGAK